MGLVTGLTGVASIGSGVFAGMIADRMNRRLLLMICDLARCLLYAAIPLAWLVSPQLWLIYLVVPLAGVFSMLFDVTYVTVVPAIVEPDQITTANGRLYASFAVAGIGGPMLAGIASGLFGPTAAIGADAASFAISACGALFIRLRPAEPAADSAAAETTTGSSRSAFWHEFLAGARFLWKNPVLRALTVLLTLVVFLTYGITDLIIYDVEHNLGHSDATVGYVLAAATAGTFAGAVLVARLRRRMGFGGAWVSALGLAGIAIACLTVASGVPAVAALAAVMSLCIGVAGICSMSLRQEITPSHLLGRVTAAFWTLHSSLGPLGAAVLTAAAAGYGVAPVFLGIGVAMVAISLAAVMTPIWQPRGAGLAGTAGC
jgi:MFS family permease